MLSVVLLEQSKQLVRQYPQNAGAHALQADILNQTGRLREAAESYARTIQLNNTQPLVWEQYLFALAETHQYSTLLSASEEAMDLFPNISAHFLLHGTALMAEGQWDEAIDVTDQALLMAGKNAYIRIQAGLQLARCFHMKMDPGRRNALLQQVFAIDESALPAMRLYLGYGLIEDQRTEQWHDILKKARQLYPEDGSLIVFETLDRTSVSPIKPERTDFDESVLKDGIALEWIGAWMASKGEKERAISWWESAVLQTDFHPETLYLIEQAKS
jgi:tetratricopeptide (TPR) repeat protein